MVTPRKRTVEDVADAIAALLCSREQGYSVEELLNSCGIGASHVLMADNYRTGEHYLITVSKR